MTERRLPSPQRTLLRLKGLVMEQTEWDVRPRILFLYGEGGKLRISNQELVMGPMSTETNPMGALHAYAHALETDPLMREACRDLVSEDMFAFGVMFEAYGYVGDPGVDAPKDVQAAISERALYMHPESREGRVLQVVDERDDLYMVMQLRDGETMAQVSKVTEPMVGGAVMDTLQLALDNMVSLRNTRDRSPTFEEGKQSLAKYVKHLDAMKGPSEADEEVSRFRETLDGWEGK